MRIADTGSSFVNGGRRWINLGLLVLWVCLCSRVGFRKFVCLCRSLYRSVCIFFMRVVRIRLDVLFLFKIDDDLNVFL